MKTGIRKVIVRLQKRLCSITEQTSWWLAPNKRIDFLTRDWAKLPVHSLLHALFQVNWSQVCFWKVFFWWFKLKVSIWAATLVWILSSRGENFLFHISLLGQRLSIFPGCFPKICALSFYRFNCLRPIPHCARGIYLFDMKCHVDAGWLWWLDSGWISLAHQSCSIASILSWAREENITNGSWVRRQAGRDHHHLPPEWASWAKHTQHGETGSVYYWSNSVI